MLLSILFDLSIVHILILSLVGLIQNCFVDKAAELQLGEVLKLIVIEVEELFEVTLIDRQFEESSLLVFELIGLPGNCCSVVGEKIEVLFVVFAKIVTVFVLSEDQSYCPGFIYFLNAKHTVQLILMLVCTTSFHHNSLHFECFYFVSALPQIEISRESFLLQCYQISIENILNYQINTFNAFLILQQRPEVNLAGTYFLIY